MGFATPDRRSGPREEQEIILRDNNDGDPTIVGGVKLDGGAIRMRDSLGPFNPRDLDYNSHEGLFTLAHEVMSDFYGKATYVSNRITNYTVWVDVTETQKIREYQVSYVSNKISEVIEIQYDAAGLELYRLTNTVSYQGNNISSISVVRSP